ncbi:hypothetical protein C8J57DRAFT_10986 [Mycena rebaudengoi]|nr:hypothetical protein C8J57DRAFT_10986 [Mycena rebaudengoi]
MPRKFAFIGPYITTPGAQELRSKLFDAHKAHLKELYASGVFKFGGPTWNDNGAGESTADRPYGGSFFVFEAENYEAALAIFKEDEYYKHGLWDIPRIIIVEYNPLSGYPF